MPHWLRARTPYFTLAAGTIALGLAIHQRGDALAPVVRDVLGDALWAAMVACWVAAAAPAIRLRWRTAVALAFCFAVEVSQLYHAPTLDALRRTTAGQLVLGSGFDRHDLAAYVAGVLAAVFVEWVTVRRHSDRGGPWARAGFARRFEIPHSGYRSRFWRHRRFTCHECRRSHRLFRIPSERRRLDGVGPDVVRSDDWRPRLYRQSPGEIHPHRRSRPEGSRMTCRYVKR